MDNSENKYSVVHVNPYMVKALSVKNSTVGDEMVSQLLPFRGVMKRQLKRRGYNTTYLPFKDIVSLYFNEFASNQYNSESSFLPVNTFEFRKNPLFRINPSDNLNGDISHHNMNFFNQVGGVVDSIVNVFRTAKMKKRYALLQGMPVTEIMTDEEITQANAATKVEKSLEAKMNNNKGVTVGFLKKILIIGLVVYLLYYLSGKK